MTVATLAMALAACVLFYLGVRHGVLGEGSLSAFQTLAKIAPLLLFSLFVAGMVQVLYGEGVERMIGASSGVRGLLIGAFAGAVPPSNMFVKLPILAGILSGGDIGVGMSFYCGWNLWAFSRIPIEVGIVGWRFVVLKFVLVLILPVLLGYLARLASQAYGRF